MRLAGIVVLTLVASALLLSRPSAIEAQPEATLIFPEDGALLAEPPPILHICFDSPVNTRDLDKGGDFRFRVLMPDDRGLGLRIIFQPDGFGIDIQPGIPEDPPQGEWTFQWRVTDPDTLEPTEGVVKFTVNPNGSPVPKEPLERCTGPSTPVPGATATPAVDAGEDDDGIGTVLLVIIVAAVAGAAFLGLFLVGRSIRRRS